MNYSMNSLNNITYRNYDEKSSYLNVYLKHCKLPATKEINKLLLISKNILIRMMANTFPWENLEIGSGVYSSYSNTPRRKYDFYKFFGYNFVSNN